MSILTNAKNWGFNFAQEAEPTDPYEGLTWFDTTSNIYYVYHESDWMEISLLPITYGNLYSYTLGGWDTTYRDEVVRITFPFDSGTADTVGDLSQTKLTYASCNSSDNAYCFAGNSSSKFSTIDRLSFPFDSGTATAVGIISQNRETLPACNSSNYGYTMGGISGSGPYTYYSTVDRIEFPFDSGTATHIGNLSKSLYGVASCNSSNYGYSMGRYTTMDRLAFPFDSGTAIAIGDLDSPVSIHGVGCNSSNYGYYMGGSLDGFGNDSSIVQRILFPFDSGTADTVGTITGSRMAFGGSNSSNYGYASGGLWNLSTFVSIIDRFAFPFDSGSATQVGDLPSAITTVTSCDGTDFVTLF